ncbi:hypothetical protein [Nonomuraea candida]|uniref:hypothetical protein n=1 Tax=Nonomuraea candida TaxID=359159 RepID=UPI0012F9DD34|nr:hypothetical protein [Nonomuraea candida]
MPTMIGHVSQERYEPIITRGREPVELQTRSPFDLGDLALKSSRCGRTAGSSA